MARTLADVLARVRLDTSAVAADAGRAGETAGRSLGDAVVRGADGRLRDARGRFVSSIDGSLGQAADEGGRKAANSINRSMAGITFGGVIKQAIGFAAVLGVGGVAGEAVKLGITTAASLEQAQVGFTTLLGSGAKAQDFLKQLSAFAAATPFELHGLVDSSRLLLGVGVDSQKVIPMLTAFGDAAGAVGVGQEAFQRIMLATSQAISAGKFQAQDMNQITENGIPIWKLLAEATGKPVPELRKMSEQGKLLASTVLPLLQKQMEKDYGGAMARQSQTLAGVWSTLKDSVSIGLANSFKPLVPILTELLPRGAGLVSRGLSLASTSMAAFITGARSGRAGAETFVGGIQTVGAVLRTVVVDISATVGWFRRHRDITQALAVTFGILGGALLVYRTTIGVITAVTKVWTGVQIALDAAMNANPIGLVVVAIAALVAGAIYAYTHFKTFREIVDGALRGIAAAGAWMWNTVLKPTFTALVGFWQNTIMPAALFLWHGVLEPTFRGIAAVVSWWWNNITKPVLDMVVHVFRNDIAPVALFLWRVFETAFTAMSIVVQIWWKIVSAQFNLLMAFVRNVLAPVFMWLWHNIVEPVFRGMAAEVSLVWNNTIKPVFNALGTFLRDFVVPAFKDGVRGISVAWDALKAAASVPVTFVVNHVINPLIHGFNDIAHAFGVTTKVSDIKGFAGGGLISGPGSGTSDSILAQVFGGPRIRVSNGEFIVPKNKVDEVGVETLNAWIGQPRVRYPGDGSQGLAFAGGGLIGFFGDVWSAITNPSKLIAGPVNAAISAIPGGGAIRDVLAGMGHKLVNGLLGYITGGAGGAGGNVGAARSFLLGQVGKPYVWASAGPGGYDCSGIVSAVWNVLHGRSPYSHTFSTMNESPYFPKPGPGGVLTAGWTNPGENGVGGGPNGVGHTAALLAGLPFESVGGIGVRVGPAVTSLGRFAHLGHFARGGLVDMPLRSYDGGGSWPSGTFGYNGSGRTEQVATGATMDAVVGLLERLIMAVESVAPGVGVEINGTASAVRRAARMRA